MKKLTKEDFIEKAKSVHGDLYDYAKVKYTNVWAKVEIVCKKHGSFNQSYQAHIYWKYGCTQCNNKNKGKLGQGKSTKQFIALLKEKYGDRYDYSKVVYTGLRNEDKITIICPQHGEFIKGTSNHFYLGSGCPKCKRSIGERIIGDYLVQHNFKHISEHKFPDCKFKNVLRFDFYLPKQNMCIEFDGAQHSNPNTHMNGKKINGKDFASIQQRDKIKNDYCKNKNITLIRIPYTELKNIKEILTQHLYGNKI